MSKPVSKSGSRVGPLTKKNVVPPVWTELADSPRGLACGAASIPQQVDVPVRIVERNEPNKELRLINLERRAKFGQLGAMVRKS